MASDLRLVEVRLDDTTTILAEVSGEAQNLRGLDALPSPGTVIDTIRKVAEALRNAGDILGWTKTTVTFEVGIEAQTGIPFLASGKATGTLGVSMDFEKAEPSIPRVEK